MGSLLLRAASKDSFSQSVGQLTFIEPFLTSAGSGAEMNKLSFQKTYMEINSLWVNCTEQRILPSVSGGMWMRGRVSGRKGVCWVRGTVSVEEWSRGKRIRWRGGLSGKTSCVTWEFGLHCGYCPTPKLRKGLTSLCHQICLPLHIGDIWAPSKATFHVLSWFSDAMPPSPTRSSQVQASGPFFHRVELVCNKRK